MRVRVCVLLVLTGCILTSTTPRGVKPRPIHPGISRCNFITDETSSEEIVKQIKEAELVFTGKVLEEFDPSPLRGGWGRGPEYRGFWVRVKRVLRGGGQLRGEVQMLVKKVGDRYMNGCSSVVKLHHTAIFLTERWNQGGDSNDLIIVTTADPIPITLTNLDQVNAIVKDMTYKPRPTLLEEPCEKKYCPWGSNCITDGAGEAHCECPTECPANSGGPVCGTDDVTYNNQCLLRRKACLQRDHTRVRHAGKCGPHSQRRRP